MNGWYSWIQQSKRCAPNSLFSLSTLDSPLDITVLLPFWVRLLLCRETKYQAHMVQLRNQSRKRTFLSQLLSLVKSSTTTVAGGCRPPRLQSESWPQQDTRAAAPGEPVPSQPSTTHLPLPTASEKLLIKVTNDLNFSKSNGQFIYTTCVIQIDCPPRKPPQLNSQLMIVLLTSLRNQSNQ